MSSALFDCVLRGLSNLVHYKCHSGLTPLKSEAYFLVVVSFLFFCREGNCKCEFLEINSLFMVDIFMTDFQTLVSARSSRQGDIRAARVNRHLEFLCYLLFA